MLTISIRPCGFKVLVKPQELEKVSEGGIHLVHLDEKLARASQQMGVLVAVGPTAWNGMQVISADGNRRPGKPWAKVGDTVWYSKWGGALVDDPNTGETYALMNDDDISAVFENHEEENND